MTNNLKMIEKKLNEEKSLLSIHSITWTKAKTVKIVFEPFPKIVKEF